MIHSQSDNDLLFVILLFILLLCILSLVVLQTGNECLLLVVVHFDELGVRFESRDRDSVAEVVVIALHVDVSGKLLNLEVVEALMHE